MTTGNQFVKSVYRAARENQAVGYLLRYFWRLTKVWMCLLLVGFFLQFLLGINSMYIILPGFIMALLYDAYREEREMEASCPGDFSALYDKCFKIQGIQ